jgi:hypothetical protein
MAPDWARAAARTGKNNIHYYNMDVNRDYGIVRAGMRRGAEEIEKSGVEERATLCAFALIEGRPDFSMSEAAAPAEAGSAMAANYQKSSRLSPFCQGRNLICP